MNHSDIESRMADYLEGDLALGERALFDAHLDQCEDCAVEIAAMRRTIACLHDLPTPASPSDLADNVMRRIAEGEGRASLLDRAADWFAAWRAHVTGPGLAVPASVLAAGLAVALVTGERGPSLSGFERGAPTAQSAASAAAPPRRTQSRRIVTVVATPSESIPKPDSQPLPPGARLGMRGTEGGSDALFSQSRRGARSHSPGAQPGVAMASTEAAAVAENQAVRTRDEWVEVLIEQPQAFAREHAVLSSIERELWTRHLARRATELQRLEEVVAALRATTDPVAIALADSFATASLVR